MVYALDAGTGKIGEREAHKAKPFGGRHRKNTYASETPFTDGERLYVSFGQNVGSFATRSTARCSGRSNGRLNRSISTSAPHRRRQSTRAAFLLHDSEAESHITALDAKTGQECGAPPAGDRLSAVLLDDAVRVDEREAHRNRDARARDGDLLRPRRQGTVAGHRHVDADGIAGVVERVALRRIRLAGRRERPFLAIKPGASGDVTLAEGVSSNDFIAWRHPRASGYTPSAIVHEGRAYLVHDTGILAV